MPVKKMRISKTIKVDNNPLFGDRSKVEVVLSNLPATIDVDEQGKRLSEPSVEHEDYIKDVIVSPLSRTIASINSNITKFSRPKYIVDFTPPDYKPDIEKSNEQSSEKRHKTVDHVIEQPKFGLSRVILPQSTKNGIEVVLSLVKHHTLMYDVWNLKSIEGSTSNSITINLYGLSGTGKTLCAEAIAYELKKDILRVKYPQLEDSLVGETNKNIQDVFRIGGEKDCVLFFDEADSILGKRLSSVTQSADHAINIARSVMLIELERFAGIVIFATNFIENYDIAFARRLLHFVRFDLPDEDSRKKIFEVHLPKEFRRVFEDSVSIDALANLTDGFSGGDIRNVVLKTAAKAASQDLPDTEKTIKQEYFLNSINEVKEAKDALMRKKVLINPDLKLN